MSMSEQQPRGFFDDAKTGMVWLTFLVRVLATSVEPFRHRRFGSQYFGFQALAVFVLIPVYAACWEGHDIAPLFYFLAAFIVMCAVARFGTLVRYMRNDHEHSRYSGYPRIMLMFPRLNELTVKRGIEPLLVLLAGIFTLPHSEPLGMYLIIAAFGLFSSVHLNYSYERQRAQDMYDAMIDQQNVTERFREMRGDRF